MKSRWQLRLVALVASIRWEAVELIDRRWWWVGGGGGLFLVVDGGGNERSEASKQARQQSAWSLAAVRLELSMAG